MERIVALCRRRGFIFGSSEIYGGIGGFWDYGPLGTELKRNIKNVWWHDMVTNPPIGPDGSEVSMVGLDCSIIMNPKVWEASGHVGGFSDPMVDCKECKGRFRADQVMQIAVWSMPAPEAEWTQDLLTQKFDAAPDLFVGLGESVEHVNFEQGSFHFDTLQRAVKKKWRAEARKAVLLKKMDALTYSTIETDKGEFLLSTRDLQDRRELWPDLCPSCQARGVLTEPREFNLMFQTHVGAIQDESSVAYLRPETAQGIFANFKNVMDSTRVKIPFGIAQIGKAFRNEINPRNYTFRSREFEQMEIEFFCPPKDSMMWYEFWRNLRLKWYESLGIKSEKLRPREQGEDELAHYSDACTDVEYLFPFSDETQELEGIAHRGCYDMSQHGKHTKGKEEAFAVLDDDTKERFMPHVIEPSAGVDRFTLAALCEAYTVDESRPSPELLKFHPRLAPIKAAVFPLVKKDGMPEIAEQIYRDIKPHYICQFDVKQSIGKRYARMDEAGTPYCFTVDGQTLEDGTVTVRDRDTGGQERIDKSKCLEFLREKLQL
jgi:glycyl-tRNA synthetase